jgi:HEAT repeat protein
MAALQGLGEAQRWLTGKLIPLLDEPDFDGTVRPALAVLYRIPPIRAMQNIFLKLLKSSHRSVRAYALRMLGPLGGAATAKVLLDALSDPDHKVQEAAAGGLLSNPGYLPILCQEILKTSDPHRAWRLSGILRKRVEAIPKPVLQRILQSVLKQAASRGPTFQALRGSSRNGPRSP